MTSSPTPEFRIEHDLIGNRHIPAAACYGVHILHAPENFPITGRSVSTYPDFIRALAAIKKVAALTNHELRVRTEDHCDAICTACDALLAGRRHEQFVVDVIQDGAGTSTNMNADEVIARRALEIMGHSKGEFQYLHPNEHANFGQSPGDVHPSAIKIALWHGVTGLPTRKPLDAILRPATFTHLAPSIRRQENHEFA